MKRTDSPVLLQGQKEDAEGNKVLVRGRGEGGRGQDSQPHATPQAPVHRLAHLVYASHQLTRPSRRCQA